MSLETSCPFQAKRSEHFSKKSLLRSIKIKFTLAHALCSIGRAGVLDQSTNNRKGQPQAAPVLVVFQCVDDTKPLGIAVKTHEVRDSSG